MGKVEQFESNQDCGLKVSCNFIEGFWGRTHWLGDRCVILKTKQNRPREQPLHNAWGGIRCVFEKQQGGHCRRSHISKREREWGQRGHTCQIIKGLKDSFKDFQFYAEWKVRALNDLNRKATWSDFYVRMDHSYICSDNRMSRSRMEAESWIWWLL